MLDQKIPARPRVALVFGKADSAGHLRDAVSDHVEIVYETSAGDFDVSRLAVSQAVAALVNLDDCESLDGVEARLQETGVAVVFNDPEISSQLDGWAQARWLRHLVAKLSGNSDFDPPRPAVAQTAPVAAVTLADVHGSTETGSANALAAENAPQLVERPLSPAEIESMTADFVALQEPQAAPAALDEAPVIPLATDAGVTGGTEITEPATAAFEAKTPSLPHAVATTSTAVAMPGTEGEHTDALDVDTEALSAMIDARLAAAEGEPVPESPEVWRVIDGDSISAVELPPVAEPMDESASTAATAAPVDEADVLKALPSVDDWQLVDPDAPAVMPSAPRRNEHPELSIDFGGLELVPMETVARVETVATTAEQWMHVGSAEAEGAAPMKSAMNSKGERA